MNIITMHVEIAPGEVVMHGYLLGIDMALAKQIAEERFHSSEVCYGIYLERNDRMEAIFDGDTWYTRGGLQ